ncbi:MAG: S53 family peptidase [Acidiphilium sp.]|nr:S53 family peptidase [Acidiphilium sp.]MDD4936983.1 S53 family peptidase [Acidiphilium sp.]
MAELHYVAFPDSHHEAPPHAQRHARLADGERVEVSVYVKPHSVSTAFTSHEAVLADRAERHQSDIEVVKKFAADHGLEVIEADPRRRLVRLGGTAAAMGAAFKVDLHWFAAGGATFRGYTGALQLRSDIAGVVESVLGLDTRPVAQPRLQRLIKPAQAASATYLPNHVGALYGIPTRPTGQGECIAIIELGGGYHESDITTAFGAMGLAVPTVVAVSVDGAANAPTTADSADGEVGLDIQVAGAIAPGARLAVYFTPNTDAGFADAVTAAATDTANQPSVMSISWGGPESGYSTQGRNTLNSALQDAANAGVTVTVASGDNLATDGQTDGTVHVDFPASSPYVVGCGGTSITVSGSHITAETVWNSGASGSGGGISTAFGVPAFQAGVKLPINVSTGGTGRGVPDVAADADPNTGYQVTVDGQTFAVGGTSAVAPLWAGFFALINAARGSRLGFVNPALYAYAADFREITTGNNIPTGSSLGYNAGPGWNACTGLGVMVGAKLFAALTANATSPTA